MKQEIRAKGFAIHEGDYCIPFARLQSIEPGPFGGTSTVRFLPDPNDPSHKKPFTVNLVARPDDLHDQWKTWKEGQIKPVRVLTENEHGNYVAVDLDTLVAAALKRIGEQSP